jgi:alginate O-acetyltransferase complex protein AlgI
LNFATPEFLVFFALLLPVYWLLPGHRPRKLLLLFASYYFYACWDWRFLGLIALSTVIDFSVGWILAGSDSARVRRSALVASLVANLGILGFFKYANFFADSLAALADGVGFPLGWVELEILLPIGISFYTFQSMSYTIDLYRERITLCRDPFDFALFVAFWPQLVAGPIVRASAFLPQLQQQPRFEARNLGLGLERVARGLAKKVVLADSLALLADAAFASPGELGALATWAGAVAFTVQIYCDFSAYSDIAIGAAQTLGYRLPENFDSPYLSRNFTEYWRRWHLSLSSWLRDYLYFSLGGNRRGTLMTYRNLFLTMLLGGLWHGAAWTVVTWGAVHGGILCLERYLGDRRGGDDPTTPAAIRTVRTFILITFVFVIFRAASLSEVGTMWEGMMGLRGLGGDEALRWSALWLCLPVLATHTIRGYKETAGRHAITDAPLSRVVIGVGAVLGTIAFWRPDAAAFIYFQF